MSSPASRFRVFPFPVVLLLAGVLIAGCATKHSDMVVARVGETPILLPEFENMFVKSAGSPENAAASTMEERADFLTLMTRFRLKLSDAYHSGLHRDPEVVREVNQYKGSLAASFLTERDVTTPGMMKMYERRKEEIRGWHILLSINPGMEPVETLAVHATATDLIAKLKAGANFSELALQYSTDPTVQQNKGDLYYFTSGQMVPAFEDAAYSLKPGEVFPTPIRTQFGLHVLKVTDRQPSKGEILCSHIMIRFDRQDPSPEDTLAAYEKIKMLEDSLALGIDFAELAIRNSQDPGSAPKGGDLSWFGRRRWILPFDEVAFTLKPGQVSGIVRTAYGYHLIKCYDTRPLRPYDEMKDEIRRLYQQFRFQDDFAAYKERLQRETRFSMNNAVLTDVIAAIDSNKTGRDTTWTEGIGEELGASPLFMFGIGAVTVDSVIGMLKDRPDLANTPLRALVLKANFDRAAEQLMFTIKGEVTEKESPGYAAIVKEYTEGILLYQIEQDRVWNSIAVTDSALRYFFERNREAYVFPDRVDISEIRVSTDSIARTLHARLLAGKTMEDLAAADSARMKEPLSFQASFAGGSSRIGDQTRRMLASVAGMLQSDAQLRAHLLASYDTTSRKTQNERLANRRLETLRSELMKRHGVDAERISTLARPAQPGGDEFTDQGATANVVNIDLTGRRPILLTALHQGMLPVSTDERTQLAHTLEVGAFSEPIKFRSWYSIIRLNKKDPARRKTFEEAGTELASAFQEYESKRLEDEWIASLQKRYPVVEYREVLQHAFAPEK